MMNFIRFFNALVEYKKDNGDLLIPRRYMIGNYRLGREVGNVRDGKIRITVDETAILNSIGFVWKVRNMPPKLTFLEAYHLIEAYITQTGKNTIPYGFVTKEGISLGHIASNLRCGKRKLNTEQRQMLTTIGFTFDY